MQPLPNRETRVEPIAPVAGLVEVSAVLLRFCCCPSQGRFCSYGGWVCWDGGKGIGTVSQTEGLREEDSWSANIQHTLTNKTLSCLPRLWTCISRSEHTPASAALFLGPKLIWVCIRIGRPPGSTRWKKGTRAVYIPIGSGSPY